VEHHDPAGLVDDEQPPAVVVGRADRGEPEPGRRDDLAADLELGYG
jgi:hypothetical protein